MPQGRCAARGTVCPRFPSHISQRVSARVYLFQSCSPANGSHCGDQTLYGENNSAGTISPGYPSSRCVSGQAVNGNVSSASKGNAGRVPLVTTLPAQLTLHLVKMHRKQLSVTICSYLLKFMNQWHRVRQSCPLIGLELQRDFVAGYSLTTHFKHQKYR